MKENEKKRTQEEEQGEDGLSDITTENVTQGNKKNEVINK